VDIRIFVEPQQGATYEEQAAMACAAESAGLDGFFRSDHFLSMGTTDRSAIGPTDAWLTLAAIARETSRIRIGTLLTSATFRLPGPLAIAVAQVDEMSAGRVELGLGAGWFEAEHQAYGIPFRGSFAERLGRLEEQLQIITGLWTTPVGEHFSFPGEYYQLEDSPALPKPVQSPRPPIIIGGSGPRRTPSIAARFGDEFNVPFKKLDQTRALFEGLDRACGEYSRDPESIRRSVALVCVVGSDAAECERRAAATGRELNELRESGAAGLVSEVADRLASYAAIGVSRVYLQLLDITDTDHVELIGRDLAPLVAAL
jgi:F420-dependent oxidoreductase-like protein